MNEETTFLTKVIEIFQFGILAMFGGMIRYLREHAAGEKEFHLFKFLIHLGIAFFVGCLIGEFIEGSERFKDGYLMAAGYCANEILNQLDSRLSNISEWFKGLGKK